MSETRKRTHFCPRAIEHGIGVCQTETCGECPLALPEFAATPPTPGTTGNAPERLDSPDAGAGCGNDPVTALPTPDLDAVLEAWVSEIRAWVAQEAPVTPDKRVSERVEERVEYFVVEDGMNQMYVNDEAEARSWAAMPNVKAYKRVTTITRVERVTEEG